MSVSVFFRSEQERVEAEDVDQLVGGLSKKPDQNTELSASNSTICVCETYNTKTCNCDDRARHELTERVDFVEEGDTVPGM